MKNNRESKQPKPRLFITGGSGYVVRDLISTSIAPGWWRVWTTIRRAKEGALKRGRSIPGSLRSGKSIRLQNVEKQATGSLQAAQKIIHKNEAGQTTEGDSPCSELV